VELLRKAGNTGHYNNSYQTKNHHSKQEQKHTIKLLKSKDFSPKNIIKKFHVKQ